MSSVDKTIADSLEYYGKQILAWAKVRARFEPVVLQLDELDVASSYSSGDALYINAYGDTKHLTAVIRALRTNGWGTDTKPEAGKPEYRAIFSVETTEEEPFAPSETIHLSFTSSVCKRVKTGTRMVEQDIYEVQCGDVELDFEPVAAAPVDNENVFGKFEDDLPF